MGAITVSYCWYVELSDEAMATLSAPEDTYV
jgi:hypothetical protein